MTTGRINQVARPRHNNDQTRNHHLSDGKGKNQSRTEESAQRAARARSRWHPGSFSNGPHLQQLKETRESTVLKQERHETIPETKGERVSI